MQEFKVRRAGKPAGSMTLEQIEALPPEKRDDLQVFFPDTGWVWPNKWLSDGSDIEVVK
jgi:hypothetical protein